MKKGSLFLLMLFVIAILQAQIKFETLPLQKIISKAKKENKLIFLQLESPECKQCNDVADKAFETPRLDILENSFVFIKLSPAHPDRNAVNEQYNTANFAGTLFMNNDGILIHRFNATTTRADIYIEQSDIAIQKSKSADNILPLQKMYASGNRNIDFLEKYIVKRNELKLPTDSLLNEYVELIPADSVRSLRVLQFIASQSPMLNSRADSVLRHDYDLFNQAWYRLPLQQRVNINHQIIAKSKHKAIETKNISYIYRVASFARNINSNPNVATKNSEQVFLDYFKGIKDTANYIRRAISFYDRFLMSISVDSIKRIDSLTRMTMLKKTPGDTMNMGEGLTSIEKSIIYSPRTQIFARELNNGAWEIYNMTNDPANLNKALQWAKRATEFFETPENLDSYARLLYKTGNKTEGIEQQKKAIGLQNKKGFSAKEYERVLKRMKDNTAVIDDK